MQTKAMLAKSRMSCAESRTIRIGPTPFIVARGCKRRTKSGCSLFCELEQLSVSVLCLQCMWCFQVSLLSDCQCQCNQLPPKTRLLNDLSRGTLNAIHSNHSVAQRETNT